MSSISALLSFYSSETLDDEILEEDTLLSSHSLLPPLELVFELLLYSPLSYELDPDPDEPDDCLF
jgi:hypothetical protein